jgi:tryptophan synthase alpha chain
MTYAAPVMAYGEDRFCADAAAAGASGLIVPDVPADEAGDIEAGCRAHGLDLVPLLAPTSADDRIALACAQAGGFIYLVSVAGVTGARERLSGRVAELARRVRAHTDLPLLVGFGISAPEHAIAALEAGADGVVIGSKAIEVSEAGGAEALAEFVSSIVAAVSPAAAS